MPANSRDSLLIVDGLHSLGTAAFADSVPLPRSALTVSTDTVMDRLTTWSSEFAEGSAPATVLAVRSDWGRYISWCEGKNISPLPASVDQLEDFLVAMIDAGRKRSTVDRYLYTVGLVHTASGLPNPAKQPEWPAKCKKLTRRLKERSGHARKQAGELTADGVAAILSVIGDTSRDLRDAALLCLASDTLCRESELVAVRVEDLSKGRGKRHWSLRVPFSKTNQSGADMDYRYVSADTMKRILAWQSASGIADGPLFRPIGGRPKRHGHTGPANALAPQEVARIFRRRALAAGLEQGAKISGHSARIGSANDLAEHGATSTQIQLAGGWKTERMVAYYTRKSAAGGNAMADLRSKK